MTAALALHVAVHCIVPPGMSSRCMASRTRACRARAFAPHFTRYFARHSALLSDVPLIAPQVVDLLRIVVQLVVLSGVFARIQVPRRCTWRDRAFARHTALHPALHAIPPSNVQVSCLERAGPVALAAFAGALAAHTAAPPDRRGREREPGARREANAEGKTKGRGTGPRRKPVCTWGWRSTARLRRRAACGARPAPMQACPSASHDRTRLNFPGRQP